MKRDFYLSVLFGFVISFLAVIGYRMLKECLQ